MSRYVFVVTLLLALRASAQEPARQGGATAQVAPQPAPGYMITPQGMLILPDAPPPMGDTSTFSGAGPKVSTGPIVGLGPKVTRGPLVGEGP